MRSRSGFVELLPGFVELPSSFVELLPGFMELPSGFVELLPGVSDIIQAIELGLTGGLNTVLFCSLLSVGSNRYGTPPGWSELNLGTR